MAARVAKDVETGAASAPAAGDASTSAEPCSSADRSANSGAVAKSSEKSAMSYTHSERIRRSGQGELRQGWRLSLATLYKRTWKGGWWKPSDAR